MYRIMVMAIASRGVSTPRGSSRAVTDLDLQAETNIDEVRRICQAIIQRRLRKIEGLRTHLKRSLVRVGRTQSDVMSIDATKGASEELQSPITRLNAQQSLLMRTFMYYLLCHRNAT